jgi:predicted AAA+ superfamily ATPase
MNLENFRKDYLKVITESTDTDLKAYIKSIVEEVMKSVKDGNRKSIANADFKNNVMSIFKTIPDNGKITQEFKDALEMHVKNYGDYQVYNFLASEDGVLPHWYDFKKKTVKLGASKFAPKDDYYTLNYD